MSGKFRICSLMWLYSLLLINVAVSPLFSQVVTNHQVYINGYQISDCQKADCDKYYGLRIKSVADLYMKKGDLYRAIEYYEKALQYIDDEANIYYSLGRIYQKEKVYYMASKYFRQALDHYESDSNNQKDRYFVYHTQILYGIVLKKMPDQKIYQKELKQIYDDIDQNLDAIRKYYPQLMTDYHTFYHLYFNTTERIK